MVNLYLIISLLFLLFNAKYLFSETLSPFINKRFEFLIIFITVGFVFSVVIFLFVHYIIKLKRENSFCLYLNLENMWSSVSMLEARKKAPVLITNGLLNSKDEKDKNSIYYARTIMDFFNHIGLQVYHNNIDFAQVYNLLGYEIINYCENSNYKLLFNNEIEKSYHLDIDPWIGFKYLADMCIQQIDYLRGVQRSRYAFPTSPPYQPVQKKNIEPAIITSNISLNRYLVVFSFLAFISLIIFLFSYLFCHGYI